MYAAAGSLEQAAELPKNFNFADEEPLIYERYTCLPLACVLCVNLLRSLLMHTPLVLDAFGA